MKLNKQLSQTGNKLKIKVLLAALASTLLINCADLIGEPDPNSDTNEDLSIMTGAIHKVGPSAFNIKAEVDGQPIDNLNLSVTPKMTMDGGMVHTTPLDSITNNNDGTYTVSLYYLMPSMGGSWVIEASAAGANSASIPVTVTGSMMDKVTLNGVADLYDKMGTPTMRPYFVFQNYVTGDTGNKTVSLFLAARDTLMSHPAIDTGLTLTDSSQAAWDVADVKLELYDNAKQWQPLTNEGGGHFSITGIDVGMTLHIRLQVSADGVNFEQKTSNGSAFDGNIDPTAQNLDGSWVSNGYGHLMVQ